MWLIPMQEYRRTLDNIEFTVVRPEHLLDVMNVNRVCLPENYTYSFFESIARDYPRAFWVALANGKIVGYIMCRVERIFSKLGLLRVRKAGHIVSVAVLPNYRRRGIASELIRLASYELLNTYGCSEVYLEVRVSNYEAINLYKKLGFNVVAVQKGYYADGEDANIMAKHLQPHET
ncbi:MAG: ribosomal protein S18-alanine N-acetyltransferase [Nitrososphaerota archaeon]